jgi:ankyrin repeat protein
MTALHYACDQNYIRIAEVLIRNGASVTIKDWVYCHEFDVMMSFVGIFNFFPFNRRTRPHYTRYRGKTDSCCLVW